MRALVADDNEAIRRLVGRRLNQRGWDILEAGNGHEALESWRAHEDELDLIVLDVDMPRVDGVEVAAEVRLTQPDLPILIMTGSGRAAERAAGAKGLVWIAKPFSVDEFYAAVDRAVGTPDASGSASP